jgi:hypothetical protein
LKSIQSPKFECLFYFALSRLAFLPESASYLGTVCEEVIAVCIIMTLNTAALNVVQQYKHYNPGYISMSDFRGTLMRDWEFHQAVFKDASGVGSHQCSSDEPIAQGGDTTIPSEDWELQCVFTNVQQVQCMYCIILLFNY